MRLTFCVALVLLTLPSARAWAEDVDLEPILPVPTPSTPLDPTLDELQDKGGNTTGETTSTLEDLVDEDEGGGGGGEAGGGGGADQGAGKGGRTPSRGTGSSSNPAGASNPGATTSRASLSRVADQVGSNTRPEISLAPPKAYTSIIGDAAVTTARRAAGLAGPAAAPMLLGLLAVAALVALSRGNDRLIRIEQTPRRRVYRL